MLDRLSALLYRNRELYLGFAVAIEINLHSIYVKDPGVKSTRLKLSDGNRGEYFFLVVVIKAVIIT